MDRGLTPARWRRAAAALLWTVALGAVLLGIDRLAFGPPAARDWVQLARIDDLPAGNRPPFPAFLPDTWRWPPHRVWSRALPEPEWWLDIPPAPGRTSSLWLGSSLAPAPPPATGAAAICLGPTRRCPPGWSVLTNARGIVLVTDAPAAQASRILEGLSWVAD